MASKNKKRSVNTRTTPVAAAAIPSGAKTHRASTAEFKPDYSYVKKDLVRIGILAGSFFVILVVLSFFLR